MPGVKIQLRIKYKFHEDRNFCPLALVFDTTLYAARW